MKLILMFALFVCSPAIASAAGKSQSCVSAFGPEAEALKKIVLGAELALSERSMSVLEQPKFEVYERRVDNLNPIAPEVLALKLIEETLPIAPRPFGSVGLPVLAISSGPNALMDGPLNQQFILPATRTMPEENYLTPISAFLESLQPQTVVVAHIGRPTSIEIPTERFSAATLRHLKMSVRYRDWFSKDQKTISLPFEFTNTERYVNEMHLNGGSARVQISPSEVYIVAILADGRVLILRSINMHYGEAKFDDRSSREEIIAYSQSVRVSRSISNRELRSRIEFR